MKRQLIAIIVMLAIALQGSVVAFAGTSTHCQIAGASHAATSQDSCCPKGQHTMTCCLAACVGTVAGAVTTTPQALKPLRAGMDFGVLATEKSIDPTANDGGYMGRLQPSQLRPELRDALKGVKAGQFTDVVHTSSGFAVLTVFSSTPRTQDLNAERIKSLVSQGAVRDTIDISGMAEADAAFQAYPKPEGWNRDLSQVCAIRTKSYSRSWAGSRARKHCGT